VGAKEPAAVAVWALAALGALAAGPTAVGVVAADGRGRLA
jgi:hypothetical protein